MNVWTVMLTIILTLLGALVALKLPKSSCNDDCRQGRTCKCRKNNV